ncbi:hypothetical protein FPHOBKDP_00205 [Listeria phage LPJP1]|nr:hypothetical protein FPHOBKDP_00205 [Listeria phage LPJP1]
MLSLILIDNVLIDINGEIVSEIDIRMKKNIISDKKVLAKLVKYNIRNKLIQSIKDISYLEENNKFENNEEFNDIHLENIEKIIKTYDLLSNDEICINEGYPDLPVVTYDKTLITEFINNISIKLSYRNLNISHRYIEMNDGYLYIITNTNDIYNKYNIYKITDDKEMIKMIKYLLDISISPDQPNNKPLLLELLLTRILIQNNNEKLYQHFKINQGTKIRDIYAPHNDIKDISRKFNNIFNGMLETQLSNKGVEKHLFAYQKKKGILDNALVHKNNKYIIKMDIASFFDNCRYEDISKYFKLLVLGKENFKKKNNKDSVMDTLFKEIFINPETGGLYQGNPASGSLSNLLMSNVAKYLKNVLIDSGITFSIYADDITFSSNEKSEFFNRKYLKFILNKAFEVYNYSNLSIKDEKTIKMSNNKRRITGIRINHNDQCTLDRKMYRLLKTIFFKLSKNKNNINNISMTFNELKGRISYYRYIDNTNKMENLVNEYQNTLIKLKLINEPKVD